GRDPSVLVRMKEDYDGAEPTASAVSVLNLLVLSHLVEDRAWSDRIERTLRLFGARLEQMGRAVPMMAAALSTYVAGIQQIVIAAGDDAAEAERFEAVLAQQYLPFAVTLRVDPDRRDSFDAVLPFVANMSPIGGHAT